MLTFNEACKVLGLSIRAMPLPGHQLPLKAPYQMLAQGITAHNTANDASALAEVSYMNGNSQEVSYHWAVDDKEAMQSIAHDRTAWHCGDGHGNGNMTTIGVEICHSKTAGNPNYPRSEENGAKLIAVILYTYGWTTDRLFKHQDWSGKYCPHRILDNQDWENFKLKVQGYLDQLKKGAVAPEKDKQKEEEEEEMKNFVVRSKSGKQGYVGLVNGVVFGIGSIDTVGQLKSAGAVELNLDDADFVRFVESQKSDDVRVLEILQQVKAEIAKK